MSNTSRLERLRFWGGWLWVGVRGLYDELRDEFLGIPELKPPPPERPSAAPASGSSPGAGADSSESP